LGNPIEQGTKTAAAPLAKGDTSGSVGVGCPVGGQEQEPRGPAEIMSLARVRARKTEPKSEIIEQIGRRLRSVYNEVLFQPVPDRFHDLISAFEKDLGSETTAPAPSTETRRKKEAK
jgi:hypothetical protein